MEYPSKEIVAIIALTILGVAFANFGVSEHILHGIVTGIAGIAGFKLGHRYADIKRKLDVTDAKFPYYYRQLIATICYLSGAFLLIEHLYTHGTTWNWTFPPGHELYALLVIIAGILIGFRKKEAM